MKVGGEALEELFRSGTWRAYNGDTLLTMDLVSPLIGPNSIDVTLHHQFLIPRAIDGKPIDPRNHESLEWDPLILGPDDSIDFQPGAFMLGAVNERFICEEPVLVVNELFVGEVADLHPRKIRFAPMYEGRSSCGRLGIASHITAGFGDYGFGGAFTLEIFNHFPFPVRLYPNMRIGQVAFDDVYKPKLYKGAYSGANHHNGPVRPKLGPDRF
jgi:dCTP deaminase